MNNRATNGAALYLSENNTLILNNTQFKNNLADINGGGLINFNIFQCLAITIDLNNSLNIINNSSFENCSSLIKGGIIV